MTTPGVSFIPTLSTSRSVSRPAPSSAPVLYWPLFATNRTFSFTSTFLRRFNSRDEIKTKEKERSWSAGVETFNYNLLHRPAAADGANDGDEAEAAAELGLRSRSAKDNFKSSHIPSVTIHHTVDSSCVIVQRRHVNRRQSVPRLAVR